MFSTMCSRLRMMRPIVKWVCLSIDVISLGEVADIRVSLLVLARTLTPSLPPKDAENKQMESLVQTKGQLVQTKEPLVQTKERSKIHAKENEDRDINVLLRRLNDPLDAKGEEMCWRFREAFPGKSIVGARRCSIEVGQSKAVSGAVSKTGQSKAGQSKAGGRSAHYDFQIQVADEATGLTQWLRVEHKGSALYKPIDEANPPWTGGVQFFNGGLEKYRLCRMYAEQWYVRFIGSGWLTKEYGLEGVPVPSLEEWMTRDAKVQGDPKTAFGMALKRAVRASGKESLRELRDQFVPDFVAGLTKKDEAEFLEDVFPVLQSSLAQKDVWLQVAGDVASGMFHTRWSPALSVSSVTGVRFGGKKDVVGELETDCAWPIRFILRWGKGAGFSNLRLDLK